MIKQRLFLGIFIILFGVGCPQHHHDAPPGEPHGNPLLGGEHINKEKIHPVYFATAPNTIFPYLDETPEEKVFKEELKKIIFPIWHY